MFKKIKHYIKSKIHYKREIRINNQLSTQTSEKMKLNKIKTKSQYLDHMNNKKSRKLFVKNVLKIVERRLNEHIAVFGINGIKYFVRPTFYHRENKKDSAGFKILSIIEVGLSKIPEEIYEQRIKEFLER